MAAPTITEEQEAQFEVISSEMTYAAIIKAGLTGKAEDLNPPGTQIGVGGEEYVSKPYRRSSSRTVNIVIMCTTGHEVKITPTVSIIDLHTGDESFPSPSYDYAYYDKGMLFLGDILVATNNSYKVKISIVNADDLDPATVQSVGFVLGSASDAGFTPPAEHYQSLEAAKAAYKGQDGQDATIPVMPYQNPTTATATSLAQALIDAGYMASA